MLTVMRSPAATARVAISSGDRRSFCCETRTDRMGRVSEHLSIPLASWNKLFLLHEHQHGWRMQQDAQPIGDALHHDGRVGQAVKSGRDLDQNAGAATLFARELIQAKRLERGAELGGEDRDFGHIASSSKPAAATLRRNVIAPTTSPETSSGAASAA